MKHAVRIRAILAACAAAGCAQVQPVAPMPPVVAVPDPSAPSPAQILARSREILDQDVTDVLGAAAMEDVRTAGQAVAVRRLGSLPRMIRQPDGSWKSEPPAVAAAVRAPGGWVRVTSAGRQPFDPVSSQHLDGLLARQELWGEPIIASAGCTDPSGTIVMIRRAPRERLSNLPCGMVGLTGEIAQIVLAGQISDWTKVPQALRPGGMPLVRFGQSVTNYFGFSSGIHDERQIDIRSSAEWEAQWRRMTARYGNPPPPPPVDFAREMVLMAAMGNRPTGGYRVVIDRVLPRPDALEAFVRHISPGPRCGTTQAITSPVDLVRVPATDKPVRWVVEQEVVDCR